MDNKRPKLAAPQSWANLSLKLRFPKLSLGVLIMRVGILGGGMQGCCCALALAERGIEVTLFDRNEQLLSRTAVANEGKIHLGYMYANDPSYSTARMMINGALAFAPFFARHLEIAAESLNVSQPAAYVVHCDSQRSAEQVSQYLEIVHSRIIEAANGRSRAYFGRDLSQKPRRWSAAEQEAEFDGEFTLAVFESPEVAINPVALTQALRERIHSDGRIKVRLAHEVLSVEEIDDPVVITKDPGESLAVGSITLSMRYGMAGWLLTRCWVCGRVGPGCTASNMA